MSKWIYQATVEFYVPRNHQYTFEVDEFNDAFYDWTIGKIDEGLQKVVQDRLGDGLITQAIFYLDHKDVVVQCTATQELNSDQVDILWDVTNNYVSMLPLKKQEFATLYADVSAGEDTIIMEDGSVEFYYLDDFELKNITESKKLMESTDYVYRTDFELTNPVNDFDAAYDYLQDDDMTKYLKDELEYKKVDQEIIDSILDIEWILRSNISGRIMLTTSKELPEDVLKMISDWVRGQNSDGLGEGFEQQDFANTYDEDEWGEPDWDSGVMASFDWGTNEYPFYLFSKPTGVQNESFIDRVFKAVLEGKTVRQALSDAILEGKPTEGSPLKIDAPRGAYWLWMDQDGNIYGSTNRPDPKKNIVDARGTVDFSSQGFDDLDEVVAYVKKYF